KRLYLGIRPRRPSQHRLRTVPAPTALDRGPRSPDLVRSIAGELPPWGAATWRSGIIPGEFAATVLATVAANFRVPRQVRARGWVFQTSSWPPGQTVAGSWPPTPADDPARPEDGAHNRLQNQRLGRGAGCAKGREKVDAAGAGPLGVGRGTPG